MPAAVKELEREARQLRREVKRLRACIEKAPCPWSACCLDADALQQFTESTRGERTCWRARALDHPWKFLD